MSEWVKKALPNSSSSYNKNQTSIQTTAHLRTTTITKPQSQTIACLRTTKTKLQSQTIGCLQTTKIKHRSQTIALFHKINITLHLPLHFIEDKGCKTAQLKP